MSDIYLDYNATSPIREDVREVYARALTDFPGNASSAHSPGRRAKAALDEAREKLAAIMNVRPREIVFTSGGTESDNLAVKGVALAAGAGHVITTAVEHPAVAQSCRFLERECFDVTHVAVDGSGRVSADAVRDAIRDDTILISIMWVNNETGVIQPIEEIAAIADEQGVAFHTDAVQAIGRIPVDLSSVPADLLSLSGHKFGAPRGTGALFMRKGARLEPVLHGGGQEWNTRSGTQNVAGAVALAEAASRVQDEMPAGMKRLTVLREKLENAVLETVPDTVVNGAGAPRVANTSNIRFDRADGEAVLLALDSKGIAASSASACAAAHTEPSHVLMAMGLSRRQAEDSMRFSLGRGSSPEDVDNFLSVIPDIVADIRKL